MGIHILSGKRSCPTPLLFQPGSFLLPGKTQHVAAQKIDDQKRSRYFFFLGVMVKPTGALAG